MPDRIRAHVWTAAILLSTIIVLWIVLANPKIVLWVFLLALAAVAYYVLYLIVRARMEGFDEPSEDAS